MSADDAPPAATVALSHDRTHHRFEITVGSTPAGKADYRLEGDRYVITHTETSPDFAGQGLASQLVRFALDEIRSEGAGVVPECPFVSGYLRRHPDDADLVPADLRARFDLT